MTGAATGGLRPAAFWNGLVITAILVNATFETMLVPALPLIRADFGLTPSQVAWAYTAYGLAAGVSLPIVGKLGDIYGPRRLLIAVISIITVGVLLPVAGHSFYALVMGQALQGVGVALLPLGIALLSEARSGSEEVRSAGLMTAAAISTAAGMVLAGLLLGITGYRALYWGAFALDSAILLTACITSRTRTGPPRNRGTGTVDWAGGLLLGGALAALLLSVSIGSIEGWRSPHVAALLGASMVVLSLFAVRSRQRADPLIDLDILKIRFVNRIALVQFFSGFGAFATFVLVPLIVQSPVLAGGLGGDASMSGFALAPFGLCCIVAPLLVSKLRALVGVARVMSIGSLVAIAGPVLLLVSRDVTTIGIATGALGFGIGLLLTQSFDLVGTALPVERVASLSSLIFVIKMIGSAFGGQISMSLVGSAPSSAGFADALTLAVVAMAISVIAALSLLKNMHRDI